MLFHCIYTSVQAHPLVNSEISQLIHHSREKNIEHGLTGVLLHVNDTFFQVLEGSAEAIDSLYKKILQDPRHTNITRIIYETIPRRYFADSSMALTTLSREDLSRLLGSPSDADKDHLLAGLDEGRAKKLLRAFSDGRWRSSVAPGFSAEASLA